MKGYSAFPEAPSSSDCLVSYPGHSLGVSNPSADVQSVYSTAPAYCLELTAKTFFFIQFLIWLLFSDRIVLFSSFKELLILFALLGSLFLFIIITGSSSLFG